MQKSTGNPDCLFVRDNLFNHEEKLLYGSDLKEFEDHLHLCEECLRIVSDFQSVTSLIEHKKSVEVNSFFQTRTLQRIASELDRGHHTPNPGLQRFLQPIMISFLLLTAILIGLSIGKRFDSKYSLNPTHVNNIETMKSDLFIKDFMDEDKTAFNNH